MKVILHFMVLISPILAQGKLPVACNGGQGECTPYHLCENGTTIVKDGSTVFDIRLNYERECLQYFEICCPTGDVRTVSVNSTNRAESSAECGKRNAEGVGFRIEGGINESNFGEFPWMVAVMKHKWVNMVEGDYYMCGGSLIHPSVVLLGAHCISERNPDIMTARIGEWDTQTTNERFGYVEHRVESLVAHPKFNRGSLYNDIALMFLEKPVAKLPHIGTICLPPQNETFDLRRCLLSGWGKNRYGAEGLYQAILKKIELKVVPPSYCEHMLQQTRLGVNFHLHDSFMCAGAEKGIDACDGDGGSPLVCETADHSGIYYQAGIVAWGEGCGEEDVPGVYTQVSRFRDWIDEQMKEKGMATDSYTKPSA